MKRRNFLKSLLLGIAGLCCARKAPKATPTTTAKGPDLGPGYVYAPYVPYFVYEQPWIVTTADHLPEENEHQFYTRFTVEGPKDPC